MILFGVKIYLSVERFTSSLLLFIFILKKSELKLASKALNVKSSSYFSKGLSFLLRLRFGNFRLYFSLSKGFLRTL